MAGNRLSKPPAPTRQLCRTQSAHDIAGSDDIDKMFQSSHRLCASHVTNMPPEMITASCGATRHNQLFRIFRGQPEGLAPVLVVGGSARQRFLVTSSRFRGDTHTACVATKSPTGATGKTRRPHQRSTCPYRNSATLRIRLLAKFSDHLEIYC